MKKTAERTLALCRKRGWIVDKAEEWVPSFLARRREGHGRWLEQHLGKVETKDLEQLVALARLGYNHCGHVEGFPEAPSLSPLLQMQLSAHWDDPIEPLRDYSLGSPGVRRDLHGFIDCHALVPRQGRAPEPSDVRAEPPPHNVLKFDPPRLKLIQSTAGGGDLRRHVRKMREECEASLRIAIDVPGVDVEIWSWRQVAAYRKDGSRAKRDVWKPRIARMTLELDFLDFEILEEGTA